MPVFSEGYGRDAHRRRSRDSRRLADALEALLRRPAK
jgi:hypothetical protein